MLIAGFLTGHELPSLIETIFSSKDEGNTIRCLPRDDAQTFIDVMDEALDEPNLSPGTRKKCLRLEYRTCGRHALLPGPLKIPVHYDRTVPPLYSGGFADVWKGGYRSRDVAVKVLRTSLSDNIQRIIGKFCKEVVTWKALRHPNILPLIGVAMSDTQFAMVSDWMVNGNINQFVKAHPDANRLELLEDTTRGLIYIHSQGMIHGDLKGANILVDQSGHARLADFGLLTIISDPANLFCSSSYTQGGTARWMGPELIAPQRFGLEKSRPTKSSDYYALGMVIYEIISGHLPFHKHTDLTVFTKVLEGERPPRGARFTGSLWEMLELCWTPQPNSRPSIEDVLRCLVIVSNLPTPPFPGVDEEMEDVDDWESDDSSSGLYTKIVTPVHQHHLRETSDEAQAKPSSRVVSNLQSIRGKKTLTEGKKDTDPETYSSPLPVSPPSTSLSSSSNRQGRASSVQTPPLTYKTVQIPTLRKPPGSPSMLRSQRTSLPELSLDAKAPTGMTHVPDHGPMFPHFSQSPYDSLFGNDKMRQGMSDLPGQNVPISKNNPLPLFPIPQTDPMFSPKNLVSSALTYSSHGQNRGTIAEPHHEFAYGMTDPNPASAWTSNTTSSHPTSLSFLLNPSTHNTSSHPRGAFGPGEMSYPSPLVHGPGQDSPDNQLNTRSPVISVYNRTAAVSHDHPWRYSSNRRVMSPDPSRPGPLHRISSGISGQPGLLSVRRARRPHPYRDDDTANRPEGQTRDIGPQLLTGINYPPRYTFLDSLILGVD